MVERSEGWRALEPNPVRLNFTLPKSPFGRLAVAHGLAAAGDALVALALSDSLFFSAGADAARDKVLLYLVLTLLPFIVLAPFIGPLVDRHADGRRWAIVIAGCVRSAVCVVLIGRLDGLVLYPCAFTILVASKSYAVARSALVPAVVARPEDIVPANSRLTILAALSSVVLVLGGIARLIFGSSGVVGLAAIVFLCAAGAGVRIQVHPSQRVGRSGGTRPHAPVVEQHDRTGGESSSPTSSDMVPSDGDLPVGDLPIGDLPIGDLPIGDLPVGEREIDPLPLEQETGEQTAEVSVARGQGPLREMFRASHQRDLTLRLAVIAMSVLRANLGVLTFLVSFTFKRGGAPTWQLGAVALVAVLGQNAGAATAPALGRTGTGELTILKGSLVLAAVVAFGLSFTASRLATGLVGLAVGCASGLGRVAFDSVVQRVVPSQDRSRSYARFETRFQLYWVLGALIPVVVSVQRSLGFGLIAVISGIAATILIIGEPALDRIEAVRGEAIARWRRPDRALDGEL